jgi:hypothetical protein
MGITSKGYYDWKKKGQQKRTIVMDHDALEDTWKVVCQYMELVTALKKQQNLPRDWNFRDEAVIEGFAKHIAPYDAIIDGERGKFLDPSVEQLMMYYKAIRKLYKHLRNEELAIDDYLSDLKIDMPENELSSSDLSTHCEERRLIKKFTGWTV